jgi:hypothetical protein
VRNHKKLSTCFFTILLIISISSRIAVIEVSAPPIGGSSFSGILTSIGSNIEITDVSINMSIVSQPCGDAYHVHTIQLFGSFNMTNPSSENANILLLYCPLWEGFSSFLNESSLETYIDGTPLFFTNQTLTNITHPRDLPPAFHDRFPDWVYVHDQLWYDHTPFIMMNLSLGPHQGVIFHFHDLITVTSLSFNSTSVGFGLGSDQIEKDSTRIRIQIAVIDGDQFIRVNPYPYDHLTHANIENDYLYVWNIQPPYSPQFFYGVSPMPINAGVQVQMEVREYHLPFVDTTTTSTSTSYPTDSSGQIPLSDWLVFYSGVSLLILVIAVLWKKYGRGIEMQ